MKQIVISQLTKTKGQSFLSAKTEQSSSIIKCIQEIVDAVRSNGDLALCKFALEFDRAKITPAELKVNPSEIDDAYKKVSPRLTKALKDAAVRIQRVHTAQLPKDEQMEETPNILIRLVYKPLESVGIYIPGGKAAYPSTALMLAIPAKVAGVDKIVACTPSLEDGKINPAVLVALDIAGITEIYRVGGAQAIAAMAYGTETISKVAKVFGPGNAYVQAAKRLLSSQVAIDLLAGPSEVVIFADGLAKVNHVIHDLVAQAEHDEAATAILVTTSEKLARQVSQQIYDVVRRTNRSTIIRKALARNGKIFLAKSDEEGIRFINELAPEHVELLSENADALANRVRHAGSVSLGPYTPVAATDYAVGVNHVLPTGGTATYASALTVFDFMRRMSIQRLTKKGLKQLGRTIVTIANAEGLKAHAESVMVRLR